MQICSLNLSLFSFLYFLLPIENVSLISLVYGQISLEFHNEIAKHLKIILKLNYEMCSPNLPTLTSSSGTLIGGIGGGGGVGGVGSIGIGVTLMPNSQSSLASSSGSHLQVTGNQGVGPQTSPQAPTYVNL